MTKNTKCAALFLTFIAVALAGCGEDRDGRASTQLSAANAGEYPEPVCPSADSEHPSGWYQAKATQVAKYILGASDPFASRDDQKDAQACERAHACSTKIRDELGSGLLTVSGGDGKSQSCGHEVGTFTLNATSEMSDVDFDDAARCAAELDACWGDGVSGFFLPERAVSERKIRIDPEPANVGAPLGAASGSTAPAVFIYSHEDTTVIELSGTSWTSAGWLAVGTPCSTGPMQPGDITSKVIVEQYPGSANKKCL